MVATIGPSGLALCSIGGHIGTPGSNVEGYIGLTVDAGSPVFHVEMSGASLAAVTVAVYDSLVPSAVSV